MKINTLILAFVILITSTLISAKDIRNPTQLSTGEVSNSLAQLGKYDELVGKYDIPRIGEFVIYEKEGKLYGGPTGRARELQPVKNEKLKFEIFRDGALFATATFIRVGKNIELELIVRGSTLRENGKSKNKYNIQS